MNLEEAKQQLRDNWKEGIACPCCRQYVKLYKRPMHATQAKMLIGLYKLGSGYHAAHDFTDGSGEFAKLRYWKLVEEMPNDSDKRTAGYWRITDTGKQFVSGHAQVPSHIQVFNKHFYGFTGDQVTITDVLGNKFNYQELMGSKGQWL